MKIAVVVLCLFLQAGEKIHLSNANKSDAKCPL